MSLKFEERGKFPTRKKKKPTIEVYEMKLTVTGLYTVKTMKVLDAWASRAFERCGPFLFSNQQKKKKERYYRRKYMWILNSIIHLHIQNLRFCRKI